MDRIITTSEISTLFMCPRKHELQYVRRLVPRRRVIFLDESIAAHHAMEQFYKGASLEKSIDAFDKVYDGHIGALLRERQDTSDAINRFLRVRALVSVYLETVGKEDRKNYDFEKVEEEFLVPVYDPSGKEVPGVMFGGKMDGVWREKKGGIRKVVEHKFLSQFDDNKNTLMIDLQVTLYALAARMALGVEVPITLYNVSKKPRFEMKDKESPEAFFERVRKTVQKKRASYFYRTPVTRGRTDFVEARRLLYSSAMMLTGRVPLPYVWRNVGMHCTMLCSYREPCLHETPRMIDGLYRVKPKLHPEISFQED